MKTILPFLITGLAFCQSPATAPRPSPEQSRTVLIGKKLPALENLDLTKAKYTIATFMSSTCPHCQNEVSSLVKLDRLAGNGESPAVGILRAQCIDMIRHGQIEDATSLLSDLGKLTKADAAKPRPVSADVQIVPVFHAQDPGTDRFLESAQWNVTPALFTKLDQAFPISGTPTTVLVGSDGVVLQAWVGEMRPLAIGQLTAFVKHPALDLFR